MSAAYAKIGGTTVGPCVVAQFKHNQTGDYSIIRVTDVNTTVTNDIYMDYYTTNPVLKNITSIATSYVAGQYVYFSGNTTQYSAMGILDLVNQTVDYGDKELGETILINGLCIVLHDSDAARVKQGDSGGIAFYMDATGNNCTIVGNISGTGHIKPNAAHGIIERFESYFSPISFARAAGFEPLTS